MPKPKRKIVRSSKEKKQTAKASLPAPGAWPRSQRPKVFRKTR